MSARNPSPLNASRPELLAILIGLIAAGGLTLAIIFLAGRHSFDSGSLVMTKAELQAAKKVVTPTDDSPGYGLPDSDDSDAATANAAPAPSGAASASTAPSAAPASPGTASPAPSQQASGTAAIVASAASALGAGDAAKNAPATDNSGAASAASNLFSAAAPPHAAPDTKPATIASATLPASAPAGQAAPTTTPPSAASPGTASPSVALASAAPASTAEDTLSAAASTADVVIKFHKDAPGLGTTATKLADALRKAGMKHVSESAFDGLVPLDQVTFYHAEDKATANQIESILNAAQGSSAPAHNFTLGDFSSATPLPALGHIEIWLKS